jgi:hypothetical protein
MMYSEFLGLDPYKNFSKLIQLASNKEAKEGIIIARKTSLETLSIFNKLWREPRLFLIKNKIIPGYTHNIFITFPNNWDTKVEYIEEERKYYIFLGKKLISYLYNILPLIYNYFPSLLSFKIKQSNLKFIKVLSTNIFIYWTNIILLHELFHIYRDHRNFLQKNQSFITAEVDADKFSAQFVIRAYFQSITKLEKTLNLNRYSIIKNILLGSLPPLFFFLEIQFPQKQHIPLLFRYVLYFISYSEMVHFNKVPLIIDKLVFERFIDFVHFTFIKELSNLSFLIPDLKYLNLTSKVLDATIALYEIINNYSDPLK